MNYEEEIEYMPEYREEQMYRLVQKDRYLMFVFEDMSKKGNYRSTILEVLFNANVIGDSVFIAAYEACAHEADSQ